MKVLITGIAGFIGSHLAEHIWINRPDWEVTGLVSFRHRGDPLRLDGLPPRYRIFHADLASPLSPRRIDQIGDIDIIFNLASESHVDRSIEDPVPFIENNVAVATTMLEYARVVKPKVFVQVSTDEVYGPAPVDMLHREWSPILPSNPYSASKAAQEAIAIAYWRTYDVPVVITNTMNNFGERQDAEKMIPMCIARIARGELVTIHGVPGNIGSRFYLHARNHADALLTVARRTMPNRFPHESRPDRWNIVGEREVDNLELAQRIADIMGKRLEYEYNDFHRTRPGHDPRYALDGSSIKRHLGWDPPVSFEDSLERTVRWTLEHPEWLR